MEIGEKERKILDFLENTSRTTKEVLEFVKLSGFECKDGSVEVLPMLEKKGLVKKSFDSKKKTFVWSKVAKK